MDSQSTHQLLSSKAEGRDHVTENKLLSGLVAQRDFRLSDHRSRCKVLDRCYNRKITRTGDGIIFVERILEPVHPFGHLSLGAIQADRSTVSRVGEGGRISLRDRRFASVLSWAAGESGCYSTPCLVLLPACPTLTGSGSILTLPHAACSE